MGDAVGMIAPLVMGKAAWSKPRLAELAPQVVMQAASVPCCTAPRLSSTSSQTRIELGRTASIVVQAFSALMASTQCVLAIRVIASRDTLTSPETRLYGGAEVLACVWVWD